MTMKTILFFPLALFAFSCSSTKNQSSTLKNETAIKIKNECPENVDCNFEILQNSSLNVITDGIGMLYYQVEENPNKVVFKYQYKLKTDENLQDGGYLEEVLFEMDESYNDFKKVNIDPAVAKVSIEQYNKYQKDGSDPDFGRKFMARSLKFPLYLVDTSPAIHHTMGGVGITPEAQVRDENDKIIPGMFAAGEVTGGVHGANRLGGNAIADTVVFGRQAGKSAAHYIINKTL